MRQLFRALALVFCLLGLPAFAATAGVNPAQVKLDLIKAMEADGFLSNKLANDAKTKYVDPKELAAPASAAAQGSADKGESLWDRYVSWTNFFKVCGVILLLVAFSGFIGRIAAGLMFLIVQVPKEVYQAVMLSATALMTLRPDIIWQSQSFYLALFGAFGNLMLLAWVVESHPKVKAAIAKLFNLGLPVASVLSFWGMLYFGALAVGYQSQIFGFFAAVCLSGILSFGIYYRPGVLTLHFHEKGTPAVVFGHLAVLAIYAGLKISGHLPAQVGLFTVGLEYYCTIAMGVGFLVGASPFNGLRDASPLGYLFLFALVAFAAVSGYFMFDLKVIGSIICCIGVLLALEWIGYMGYRVGFLFGTFLLGIALYGASLLAEHYGHLVVLRLA